MFGLHTICPFSELDDPGSRAFTIGEGDWPLRGFLVRVGDRVAAYVNRCPHAGHPLDWRPDEFLTIDKTAILCRSHGAIFDRMSGACIAGPCAGRGLRSLHTRVENGYVMVEINEGDDA